MSPRHPAAPRPAIDPGRCTGCGRCVAACPPRVLSLETGADWRKTAVLHLPAGCTGCSVCALRCPFDAIAMATAPPGPRHPKERPSPTPG